MNQMSIYLLVVLPVIRIESEKSLILNSISCTSNTERK